MLYKENTTSYKHFSFNEICEVGDYNVFLPTEVFLDNNKFALIKTK